MFETRESTPPVCCLCDGSVCLRGRLERVISDFFFFFLKGLPFHFSPANYSLCFAFGLLVENSGRISGWKW